MFTDEKLPATRQRIFQKLNKSLSLTGCVSELSRVFCPSASRRGVRTPHSGEHHRETRNLIGGAASRVEELQLGLFHLKKAQPNS